MRNFWARFAAEFWRGFDEARAQSALSPSTAAPIEIDASHPFFASDEYKRVLAGLIRAAFADGEQAEKTRIFAITRLPVRGEHREARGAAQEG
jgi:hypothetical protein